MMTLTAPLRRGRRLRKMTLSISALPAEALPPTWRLAAGLHSATGRFLNSPGCTRKVHDKGPGGNTFPSRVPFYPWILGPNEYNIIKFDPTPFNDRCSIPCWGDGDISVPVAVTLPTPSYTGLRRSIKMCDHMILLVCPLHAREAKDATQAQASYVVHEYRRPIAHNVLYRGCLGKRLNVLDTDFISAPVGGTQQVCQ